jgi:hypothetical protein
MAGKAKGGGEVPSRKSYTLSDAQVSQLQDAKHDDHDNPETPEQTAFWRAACDTLGLNPLTVATTEETFQYGTFTAWPAGYEGDDLDTADMPAAHERAMAEIDAAAETVVFERPKMVGQVRDLILTILRSQDRLMHQKSEAEQRDTASHCQDLADTIVGKIAEVIASGGKQPIRALMGTITMGESIKIAMVAKPLSPADEDASVRALRHAYGKHVVILVASADDFKEELGEADVESDEPPLNFDADAGDDEEQDGDQQEQ